MKREHTGRSIRALCALAAALALPAASALAQEPRQAPEVVVTATRVPTPADRLATSVTVITRDDIERRQGTVIYDVLREVPGLSVNRTGGQGSLTEVRIRGTEANQVVVLIDGVEVTDPAFGSQFDFADLPLDNVDRIEIVRGPQSTLYGGDAIGGVIQIFTKRAKERFAADGRAEIGDFNTRRLSGHVGGRYKWANLSLNASLLNTDGISIAERKNGNPENDGFRNVTVSALGGITPIPELEITGVYRFIHARAELDSGFVPGFNVADDDSEQERGQRFLKVQAKLSLFDDLWEQIASYSWGKTNTTFTSPANIETFGTEGTKRKIDYQTNVRPMEGQIFTAGIDRETEVVSQTAFPSLKRSGDIDGYYVQHQASFFDRIHLTGGFRRDNSQFFGNQDSWRATAAYVHKETGTKIKGTFGTGFKSPTLQELFTSNPVFGIVANPDLRPEFTRSWDAGVEQRLWDERLVATATYFRSRVFDLIQNTGTFPNITPRNVGRARIHGVEATLAASPVEGVDVTASYTWTVHQDEATNSQLLRRPKQQAGANVNLRPIRGLNVNLGVIFRGTSVDTNFGSGQREMLQQAVVLNLAASYEVSENLTVFARVENLTNAQYQEVADFGTPGRAFFVGLRGRFSIDR